MGNVREVTSRGEPGTIQLVPFPTTEQDRNQLLIGVGFGTTYRSRLHTYRSGCILIGPGLLAYLSSVAGGGRCRSFGVTRSSL